MKYIALVAGMLILAAPVEAAPVFSNGSLEIYLNQNTFPSGLVEEQVFFDAGTGPLVIGHVGSQTGIPLVHFNSPTSLDAAGGFAQIGAFGRNAVFNQLTITVPGYTFGDLMFSTFKADNVTISAFSNELLLGTYTQNGLGNGAAQWLTLATGGAVLTSLLLSSTDGFEFLKQVSISSLAAAPDVVPLPGAIVLFGSALAGMLGFGSWRRRRGMQYAAA